MRRPSLSEPADPLPLKPLVAFCTAPLGAVLLAILALWVSAIPTPQHSVSLDLNLDADASGPEPRAQAPAVHTVTVDADGTIRWDGQALAGRAAVDARTQAVGAAAWERQAEVYVRPHKQADYGAVAVVMASAQRNDVRKLGMIDDDFVIRAALRWPYE